MFFVLAWLLGGSPSAALAVDVEPLLAQAGVQRLHEDPYWLTLLHYRDHWWGAESVVDDPRFFLSPRGKSDPESELQATIRALYAAPDPGGQEPSADPRGGAPRCRFPARAGWLAGRLGAELPDRPEGLCSELDAALERIQPRAASLVFPTAHMNNPGSMFGHTLLRIDSPYQSALLSHAVNYAAEIDPGDGGIAYAFKGVFGRYPGYYTVLPYYEKVKQYSDMEQRDVWEYALDLDADEVRQLTLHAWELRGIRADYYFFDENCSYNLLFLIQAARPGLELTDGYGPWVTPLATVEDVLAAGLSRRRTYRPSQATVLRHVADRLGEDATRAALAVARNEMVPSELVRTRLSAEDQARVLDIAVTFEQARLVAGEVEGAEYQRRYLEVLRVRSTLPSAAQVVTPVPEPAPPESGHSSSRISIGAGVRSGRQLFQLSFRPAYHELLDPDPGYLPGSQINFFSTTLRLYLDPEELRLQAFDAVDIVSLSPRDEFFKPVSFKVRAGLRSKPFTAQDDGLVGVLNAGGGFSWGDRRVLAYLLAESELDVSGRYADGVAWGVGAGAGLLANPAARWKVQLEARAVPYLVGVTRPDLVVRLRQMLRLARNHSVFLDLERSASFGVYHTELTARWNLYF